MAFGKDWMLIFYEQLFLFEFPRLMVFLYCSICIIFLLFGKQKKGLMTKNFLDFSCPYSIILEICHKIHY